MTVLTLCLLTLGAVLWAAGLITPLQAGIFAIGVALLETWIAARIAAEKKGKQEK